MLTSPYDDIPVIWIDSKNVIVASNCTSYQPYIAIEACDEVNHTIAVINASKDRDNGVWQCIHKGIVLETIIDCPGKMITLFFHRILITFYLSSMFCNCAGVVLEKRKSVHKIQLCSVAMSTGNSLKSICYFAVCFIVFH